jgi:hypothetical protein
MSNKRKLLYLFLILLIVAAVWYMCFTSKKPVAESGVTDLGKPSDDGRKLIEITGSGGNDDGKKVQGYELPDKIEDLKFPLEVIVRPNQNLFGGFFMGEKVTATHSLGDSVVFRDVKVGEVQGDYDIFYDFLKKQALATK